MLNPTGHSLRATQENVWQAAEALQAAQLYPSVNRVREWLGGGSNSSISQYLRKWHEHQKTQAPQRGQAPDLLQSGLNALYQQMEVERDEAINAAKQQFDELAAQLKQEIETTQSELEAVQLLLQQRTEQLENVTQQLADSQQQSQANQRQLDEMTVRYEARGEALEQSREKLSQQEKQLEHLFHQQMAFQERLNEDRRQEASRWEQMLWQQQAQVKELQDAKLDETEQRLDLTRRCQSLQATVAQQEKQLAKQAQQQASLELTLSERQEEAETLKNELVAARQALNAEQRAKQATDALQTQICDKLEVQHEQVNQLIQLLSTVESEQNTDNDERT